MVFSKLSFVAVAFGVVLSLLAVPSAGHAGPVGDFLFPTVVSPAPTAVQQVSWMPAVGNPAACNPCQPQVSMVPETKRRWTYSRIPKTSFQPVTTCDPCTGCPVTSYRPQTTYSLLPWLHRQSYTIYKPAAAPLMTYNASYNPCCDPCGGVSSSNYISGTSGCSTCSSSTTSSLGSSTRRPDPGYSQRTYATEPESSQGNGSDLTPKPEKGPKSISTEVPELNSARGRTAVRPIQPAAGVRTVSWELSAAPGSPSQPASKPKLDVSGWHAVTD